MRQDDEMKDDEVLEKIIEAWESLPSGNHSVSKMQAWLSGPMVEVIDLARAQLGRRRPDGSDPRIPH